MSWQIREGIDQSLTFALYVRDAAGLDPFVVTEPDVGALQPSVSPLPERGPRQPGSAIDLRAAVQQWPQWWHRALQAPDRSTLLPGLPEWEQLRDLPVVKTWAERLHHSFHDWLARARGPAPHSRSRNPLHLTRFVNAFEVGLGRPVRPFTLRLRALPQQAAAGWVIDTDQVLVSLRLLDDAAALESFLAPVIRAVA